MSQKPVIPLPARDILEVAEVILVAIDTQERVTMINRKGCAVLGVKEKEILGRNWFDTFVPEEDRDRTRTGFAKMVAGKLQPVEYFENRIIADGTEKHIAWHNSLLRDQDGRIIGTLSSGTDITDQMKTETALREREAQFRVLIQETHSCILLIEDRIIKFANQATLDQFNVKAQDVIGHSTRKFYPSDKAYEETGREIAKALDSVGSFHREMRLVDAEGQPFWIDIYISKLNDHSQVAVFHNITDRVRAVEALKSREATLQSIFRAAPIGIGLVENRVLRQVNQRLCDMLGYSADELVDQSSRLLYESDEEFERVGQIKYKRIEQAGTGTVETRWARKDGRVIDILLSSTPLDQNDHSRGVTFTALDITERKAAEDALQRSERLLTAAHKIATIGSFEWNIRDDASLATDEAFRILGLDPHERPASFETFFEFVHPEDRERVLAAKEEAMTTGTLDFDHRIIRADGAVRTLHLQGEIQFDTEGQPYRMIGTFRDITERKENEQALREKNIALREILKQVADETNTLKKQIAVNIEETLLPTLARIKESAPPHQLQLLSVLEQDFLQISSPFLDTIKSRQAKLTPREVEISRLIRNGMTSKEIADTLGLAPATVHKHREMIRRKLGLANKNVNLATYLQTL